MTITLYPPISVQRCHQCADPIGITDGNGRRLRVAESICQRCRSDNAEWTLTGTIKCRGCRDVIGFQTPTQTARLEGELCAYCSQPHPAEPRP